MNLSQTPDAVLNRGGWLCQPQGGVTFVNGVYSATPTDRYIFATAAAGYTLTLPPALQVPQGFALTVKKIDAAVATVTIAASGTDKIDGAATYAGLTNQYYFVNLVSDGVGNWFIVGNGII